MSLPTRALHLTVNGRRIDPVEVPEGLMMIDFLHEYLDLTGPRLGCGLGICHACTVIVDEAGGSVEMRTCIIGAHDFDGKTIRTIEGHATRNAAGEVSAVSAVQQAFLDHYSFQCGYCTPGFVNAATVLVEHLKKQPIAKAAIEEAVAAALEPHLCRCTGYVRYHEAVRELILATPGLTLEESSG